MVAAARMAILEKYMLIEAEVVFGER